MSMNEKGEIERGRYTRIGNKIGLFINRMSEVVLSFPFKDCILEGGMTKEEKNGGRDERFFHEVIDKSEIDTLQDQKVLTNFSTVDIKGEKKVKNEKDVEFFDEEGNLKNNLLIKGNNLLSLYSLREKFGGRVKMIYIDPPYNTGGDANIFTYNNNFNHSAWLTFMKNRLEVAKDLLRDDGMIAIAIDDFESAYLKVLCDEIFQRENFIGTLCIETNPGGRDTNTFFATSHEYCHFYAKNSEKAIIKSLKLNGEQKEKFNLADNEGRYKLTGFMRTGGYSTPEERPNSYYSIFYNEKNKKFSLEKESGSIEILPIDSSGRKRVWRRTKPSFIESVSRNDVIVKNVKGMHRIFLKDRLTESRGKRPKTMWYEPRYSATTSGTMFLRKIIGRNKFSYPKSIFLVQDILGITTSDNDIILDFFSGSGTTGHATLALNAEDGGNRKFILCEQIDEHFDICKERLTKVLQQSKTLFSKASEEKVITFELKKYNKIFFDCIDAAKTKEELKKCYRDMQKSAFLQFWFDKKEFEENGYQKLPLAEQKNELKKILDLNQMYLNYPDMEDATYNVAKVDKDLTYKFYE